MPTPACRTLMLLLCLLLPWGARATSGPDVSIGAGMQRMPAWAGARTHRSDPIPFLDVEWSDYASVSTQDGLQLDLIRGQQLHGGVYGYYQWGRDHDDLGPLGGKVPSLSPRATLGGYLEWQLDKQIDVGGNLSHDISGAGAYLDLYAEWDLPALGVLQHSLQLRWQAMNAAAMQRFFGISPAAAGSLHTAAWRPSGGDQLTSLEYDLFVPTGTHTGFAAALDYGRLLGNAAASPLVRDFGSRNQLSESLAFVYRFSAPR